MADPGSTILNLPATAALGDTDVLPLARPSGTTAPGTDLGITGAALKAIIAALAAKGGLFRGAWAANTKYLQYDSTFIPAGNPNAGLLAFATVAFTSPAAYLAGNWTLEPGQSSNDYTSPEKAKLAGLATVATSGSYADLLNKPPAATFATITGAPADNANLTTALGLKVDKVTGLALSSNDYTSPEKAKLAALATVATSGSYPDLLNKPALYATTGTNTDGWITQKGATDALFAPVAVEQAGLPPVLYTDIVAAVLNAPAGSTVRVRRNVDGGATALITAAARLVIEGGATLTCSSLEFSGALPISVAGAGTFAGTLVIGPAPVGPFQVELGQLNGQIFHYSYNQTNPNPVTISVVGTRWNGPGPLLRVDYGFSGNYHSYVQADIFGCVLTATVNEVISYFDNAAPSPPSDPAASAANRVRLVGSTIIGVAGKRILNDSAGFTQLQVSGNTYVGISAPAQTYVVHLPADGSMTAAPFTPITQNQYGTHPAFSAQFALNAYLLGGAATVPTTSTPTFTAA